MTLQCHQLTTTTTFIYIVFNVEVICANNSGLKLPKAPCRLLMPEQNNDEEDEEEAKLYKKKGTTKDNA